jgi:hypothetical protein
MSQRITAQEASRDRVSNAMSGLYKEIGQQIKRMKEGDGHDPCIFVNRLSELQKQQLEADGYRLEKVPEHDEFYQGTEYNIRW